MWDALAHLLAKRGFAGVPATLDRDRADGTDGEGTCLFTQTCGYLLYTTARDQFTILGAPVYDVPGCSGPLHRSFIVVRETATAQQPEDLRGGRFAINESGSNSGMNLPRLFFAPLAREGRFFGSTVVTGSHAASAELVSDGGADAAAIDCVTFALLKRYRPEAVRRLRILAQTAATPAPPFVTARATGTREVAALRDALEELTHAAEYADVRDSLFLRGVDFCDERAYDVITVYEDDARRLRYPILH